MSLSTRCLRRVVAPVKASRRYESSTSSSAPTSTSKKSYFLTPEKKRALISLYHQSDTFITPENLSSKIDEAFVSRKVEVYVDMVTPKDLKNLMNEKLRAPKFREWNRDKRGTAGGQWSAQTTHREWKVIEALYGVDASDRHNAMPSLEALEEFESKADGEEAKLSQAKEIPSKVCVSTFTET
ncbi:hypothetical protein MPER_12559 [Moniliophthora perniciosa FA553]|nr:hypothetical protein MPER_12559 [Moniliophthora perniciosa FA553]